MPPPSPGHGRSSTDPGDRTLAPPPGRRAGDLIAFFEDRTSTSSPGHTRTTSLPAGPRSPSPYLLRNTETTTTTGYSYRSSSPAKSATSTHSGPSYLSSLLSPQIRGTMSFSEGTSRVRSPTMTTSTGTGYLSPGAHTNTFSQVNSGTFTNTNTANTNVYTGTDTFTPSGTNTYTNTVSDTLTPISSLRRPQSSPRSPLTSVRNIVAAWKERTPTSKNNRNQSTPGSATSAEAASSSDRGEGLFSLRRRAERGSLRLRDSVMSGGGRRSGENLRERARSSRPDTPLSSSASGVPPPFDAAELGTYARESREVSLKISFTFLHDFDFRFVAVTYWSSMVP